MSGSLGLTPELADYVRTANRPEHSAMVRCREETARDHADQIGLMISPEQASFHAFLVTMISARDAIEIGVFTGYSALAVALAMHARHDGEARLVACDVSADYMAKAVGYFAAAGVDDVVEPRVGAALDSLDHLLESGEEGGFDYIFVDADKTGYADYYERGLSLLRPGGVMAFDNMLWGGAIADPATGDADILALRALTEKAKGDGRVDMSLAAIGDGLLICMKR